MLHRAKKRRKPAKPIFIVKKYGYEYYLVEGDSRSGTRHAQPCFMGHENYALKGCKKICEKSKKK